MVRWIAFPSLVGIALRCGFRQKDNTSVSEALLNDATLPAEEQHAAQEKKIKIEEGVMKPKKIPKRMKLVYPEENQGTTEEMGNNEILLKQRK